MKLKKMQGINILSLEGEITFERSNSIKDEAKKLLQESDSSKTVVDLQGVPALDSSGVGVLISLYKYQRENDGKLVIAAPTEKVAKVLNLTRLDKIIDIYPSVDEAVESF